MLYNKKNDIHFYIFFITNMGNLILNDDILSYMINHVDIKDYNKLKKVSVGYRKLFNLNLLIKVKNYNAIISIHGSSICYIIDIVNTNIVNKYKLDKNKSILDMAMQNYNEFNKCVKKNMSFILECFVDIHYNSYNYNYECIMNTINRFYIYTNKINIWNYDSILVIIHSYVNKYVIDKYIYHGSVENYLLYINIQIFYAIIMYRVILITPDSWSHENWTSNLITILYSITSNIIDEIEKNKSLPEKYKEFVSVLCTGLTIDKNI